jgi:two-component system chemotaxis sensor kinase CheA
MQRIVRDTAQALGKDVQLVLVGEDTELDKNVLEKINDPLVHLVRNSVDHGVENPTARAASGKGTQGKVTLAAFHRSGRLIIEVKDDGGGINPEKLRQKAIQKGLIKESTVLSEKQTLDLVFAPSFSTKEEVTDISGRGVGMDVVKTNIESLQGEVSVTSKLGEGSVFSISLPLTLAIIEGMIVKCGADKFVVPINHIHESLRPEEKDIQNTSSIGQVLLLRGENLPAFKMAELFGKKDDLKLSEMIALVIRSQGFAFTLFVDDILGKSQVVIKQLGSELSHLKGISGSTILGDGKPALIVEPQDLIKTKLNQSLFESRRVS